MEKIVDELLDLLEERGYECKSAFFSKECCGDSWVVDYNYDVDSEYGFRITVWPDRIEITRLFFKNILISYAKFESPEQVIRTIAHCKEVDMTEKEQDKMQLMQWEYEEKYKEEK